MRPETFARKRFEKGDGKIEVIRAVRERYGLGLRDAKALVLAVRDGSEPPPPDPRSVVEQKALHERKVCESMVQMSEALLDVLGEDSRVAKLLRRTIEDYRELGVELAGE